MEKKCEGTPSNVPSKWYIVLVHLPYGEDVIALTLFLLSNFQEYNSFLLKALGITGADKRMGGKPKLLVTSAKRVGPVMGRRNIRESYQCVSLFLFCLKGTFNFILLSFSLIYFGWPGRFKDMIKPSLKRCMREASIK